MLKAETATCQLYTSVTESWESMLQDCEAATTSIYMEQYIFQNDAIGKRFIEVFLKKVAQGVEVRLLLDIIGSWSLYRNFSLLKQLTAEGVLVRWYNPTVSLLFWRTLSVYFRDHRKMLVVDGAIGHTGGVGVNATMASWRDTHGRLMGPVVAAMQASFLELWLKARKPIPHLLSKPHVPAGARPADYEFLPNSPGKRRRFIYHATRDAIRGATRQVWITMPYFIPDLGLFRTLRLAARRGVDVRILLPKHSDVRIMDAAMRSYFGMALSSGIKLYTYEPAVLHAKVVLCDDNWATFGSMNWDNMSFRYNLEGNIVVGNKQTIQDLAHQFLQDLTVSKEVDYKTWQERPMREKLFELLLWPFHFLL